MTRPQKLIQPCFAVGYGAPERNALRLAGSRALLQRGLPGVLGEMLLVRPGRLAGRCGICQTLGAAGTESETGSSWRVGTPEKPVDSAQCHWGSELPRSSKRRRSISCAGKCGSRGRGGCECCPDGGAACWCGCACGWGCGHLLAARHTRRRARGRGGAGRGSGGRRVPAWVGVG